MGNSIYTSITEETATGARDRVLDDLNRLTGGAAYLAIKYVNEFLELDLIVQEFKERQRIADAVDNAEKGAIC